MPLANERHREIVFDDEAALRKFVASLHGEREDRAMQFSKPQLYVYVRENATDPEWSNAVAGADAGGGGAHSGDREVGGGQ